MPYSDLCFEGHRVISVVGLLLSVLPSLNKAYYYYYYLALSPSECALYRPQA